MRRQNGRKPVFIKITERTTSDVLALARSKLQQAKTLHSRLSELNRKEEQVARWEEQLSLAERTWKSWTKRSQDHSRKVYEKASGQARTRHEPLICLDDPASARKKLLLKQNTPRTSGNKGHLTTSLRKKVLNQFTRTRKNPTIISKLHEFLPHRNIQLRSTPQQPLTPSATASKKEKCPPSRRTLPHRRSIRNVKG